MTVEQRNQLTSADIAADPELIALYLNDWHPVPPIQTCALPEGMHVMWDSQGPHLVVTEDMDLPF